MATEIEADLVILDETLGRYHAKHGELAVTGTHGILLKAKKSGFIKEIKPLLSELKEKQIWLGDSLIKEVLKLANE